MSTSTFKIRIIKNPERMQCSPGVRHKLVSLLLPLASTRELAKNPPDTDKAGEKNFVVLRTDLINVLKREGRYAAVTYWSSSTFGNYVFIPRESCEVVGSRPKGLSKGEFFEYMRLVGWEAGFDDLGPMQDFLKENEKLSFSKENNEFFLERLPSRIK